MKPFLIVLTLIFYSALARTQSPEDSVRTVINTLFFAMKNARADTLSTVFSSTVIFQSVSRTMEGEVVVKNENVQAFIEVVGKSTPGSLDERIVFETLKVDGPLAIAWTPYQFFYNGKFSHCGVNSFQLVRLNGSWKIQYLIDTRRTHECK